MRLGEGRLTDLYLSTIQDTQPQPQQAPQQQTQPPESSQQPQPQQQAPPKKQSNSQEFRFPFKKETGGGYYKVRVKRDSNGLLKWNFGYYSMPEMEKIELSPERMREEGVRSYHKFKAFLDHLQPKQEVTEAWSKPEGYESYWITPDGDIVMAENDHYGKLQQLLTNHPQAKEVLGFGRSIGTMTAARRIGYFDFAIEDGRINLRFAFDKLNPRQQTKLMQFAHKKGLEVHYERGMQTA